MSESQVLNAAPQQPDDEISLLDLLGTLTAHLRVLVLVPLLVGLLVLGITSLLPPWYESRSVLRLGEETTALLASDDLLTPLLPLAPWVHSQHSRSAQLLELKEHLQPSFSKKDGTLSIVVTGPSPEQAQRLNQAAIDALRNMLKPKGKALDDIQQRQAALQATLAEINTVLPTLSQTVLQAGTNSEANTSAYSMLFQQRLTTLQELQELNNSLKPFGDEAIAQAPSLPDLPVKSKKALAVMLAVMVTGFLVLIFVLIRHAVSNAANNPHDAARMAAIRHNLSRSLGLLKKN